MVMARIIFVIAGLAAVCATYGQVRVVRPGPRPVPAMPMAQPEPTVRVSEDPLTVFQKLIGSSSEQRRQAIVELGWTGDEKFAEDPSFVRNARFYRVNLDDDPEYEAIMTVDIGFPTIDARPNFQKIKQSMVASRKFLARLHVGAGRGGTHAGTTKYC